MLDKMKYVNHIGQELKFGENGLFLKENDIRDYAWSINTTGQKINGFKRSIIKKTLPLIVFTKDAENVKNKLFEIAEKDILAKKYGRLYVGKHYMLCYITEMRTTAYLQKQEYSQLQLGLQTDIGFWIKESTTMFKMQQEQQGKRNLDYNVDFAYTYLSSLKNVKLVNDSFATADFELKIYGAVEKPMLFINSHKYRVACSVEKGEILVINSLLKKVYIIKRNGEIVNCFHLRDKENYLFTAVPSGVNAVNCDNSFDFDITLIEKRSMPEWT